MLDLKLLVYVLALSLLILPTAHAGVLTKERYVSYIKIDENNTGSWELNRTITSLADFPIPLEISQIGNESNVENVTFEHRIIYTKEGRTIINYNSTNITLYPNENLTMSLGGKVFPNHENYTIGDIDFLSFSSVFDFYLKPTDDFICLIELPYATFTNEVSKRYYPFIQFGSYYHTRDYILENFNTSFVASKNRTYIIFEKSSKNPVQPDFYIIAESFPAPKVSLDIFDEIKLAEGSIIERSIKISNMQNSSLYYLDFVTFQYIFKSFINIHLYF